MDDGRGGQAGRGCDEPQRLDERGHDRPKSRVQEKSVIRVMKRILLLCLISPFLFAGCAHGPNPKTNPTAPTGPCRDDENFVNGRCEPRIPGDRQPPGGVPPWTRP